MGFKKVISAGIALIAAATLTACSPGSGDSTAETDGGLAKAAGDTFTIGFDASFPPYGYKDESTGEYVGFDIDLAAEVAKRNDWELVKQPIDWASKDMELDSGTIDAIWNGFTMNGREDNYTWSDPYVDNSIVFVTKAGSGIDTKEQLAGKNVLVQADSSGLAALQDDANKDLVASFASLTEVPDYNNAFMNLEAGAGDAIAVDLGVANYQISQNGSDKFVIMEPPFHEEQYGIGFKKGNTALRDQVQQTLDAMKADGTFTEIAEKYDLENAIIMD